MALQVTTARPGPLQLGAVQPQTIGNVIRATPGSNGFIGLPQPKAVAVTPVVTSNNSGATSGTTVNPSTGLINEANAYGSGAINAGNAAANTYQASAAADAAQLAEEQNNINSSRQNIGLNQIGSIKSLIHSVQQGLQSGRVSLGNSGALDSSAAGALGRAYQGYQVQQQNSINNQAAVQNNAQDTAQTNLGIEQGADLTGLHAQRDGAINQIQQDLNNELAYVDNSAATSGTKIDSAGIKNRAVTNAQAKLAAVDSWLTGTLGSQGPTTKEDTAAKAYALSNQGVTGNGGISYDTSGLFGSTAPTSLSGAPISQLPLYSTKKTS